MKPVRWGVGLVAAAGIAVFALPVLFVPPVQPPPAKKTCGQQQAAPVDVSGLPAGDAQLRNATIVARVAAARGLAAPAAQIGIMTILVEARGLNVASQAVPESINYPNDGVQPGDHDSVGIFQQRASWGSVQQRMDPAYAAGKFFDALAGLPYATMSSLGAAAQAVQRSAFPSRYDGKAAEAAALLAQVGKGTVGLPVVLDPTSGECSDPGAAAGGTFVDGNGAFNLPRANPRTVAEAIAYAKAVAASGAGGYYRRCLAFVAEAYGWSGGSGVNYAIDLYTVYMPASMRHDGDRNPPPGALLFWSTSSRAGHVAVSVGGGLIASNDIVTNGQISVVPASDIEAKWGAHYLGWAPPYFPKGA